MVSSGDNRRLTTNKKLPQTVRNQEKKISMNRTKTIKPKTRLI